MNVFILTFSLLYGIMPFDRLNPRSNIFDYIQMYIIPIFYLICYGLTNFGSFGISQNPSCDSVCRLGNALLMHLGCFLYISMHALNLWRRKKFFIVFEHTLHDIDENLRRCEVVSGCESETKPKKKKPKYLFYGTWIVVILAFTASFCYDVRELVYYYHEYFFITLMVSNFPYSAASVMLGQFIYFVSEISQRFEKLNELFEKISTVSDRKHIPLMIFDIETDAKKELPPNQQIRHRHFAATREESDELNDDLDQFYDTETIPDEGPSSESNLPDLFKLHDKILSLSVITNAEYGPQSVPYMAVCFVITIFGIFLLTKVFFVVGGKSRLLDYVIILFIVWSLTTMVVAYLVLRLCCNANGFSKQSAMIVHEIMQKKPAFMLGNDLYYNKMKSFTLQFLHWEGYFQFNGIGLFTLDYTFIFSTVSAATSYLIVLLQFDMSSILKSEGLL
ncbi:gustatory and pheromone receptor 33a-like [Musca vetustissima]|uniref:gustatory and pheromone receptor 33a-like n=1 Tax=Musca vetustissima TaxID=27455 RepID=UPI002AB6EF9E|nr:gustatory and pheromone receptor 33a-like [Musca vetustissima]